MTTNSPAHPSVPSGTGKLTFLITGSKGFIGSKVTDRIRGEGHEVIDFDSVDGMDLLNAKQVEEAVIRSDIVYHIAAQADLTKVKDVELGRQCFDVNTQGTHNVAYACAKHGKWIIYISTVCVYGGAGDSDDIEDEDHTLPKPNELYAASKYAGEHIILGYAKSFDLAYTILRIATTYGPGMREALGVYVFFEQAYKGIPITVHGTGEQDRTQTFVEDLADGIAMAYKKQEAVGHVINLTASERISANRMAESIKKLTNSPSPITHTHDRKNQTRFENISTEKARRILGWSQTTSFEDGLKKTAAWIEETRGYKKFPEREKTDQ